MIPPCGENLLLPPAPSGGPWTCTRAEVIERFGAGSAGPDWRRSLIQSWDDVRSVVSEHVPSATWWLWGWSVSDQPEPLFGDDETVSTLVILPVGELVGGPAARTLLPFLREAAARSRVDAPYVIEYPTDHPAYLVDTVDAIESKWRPRAQQTLVNAETKALVPAGYLEVRS